MGNFGGMQQMIATTSSTLRIATYMALATKTRKTMRLLFSLMSNSHTSTVLHLLPNGCVAFPNCDKAACG